MTTRRKIIKIDEAKCTGCGQCIPNCPEGALQIIDGKARLVSDLFCDGLGACVGHCPEGAMTVEERPAEPYNEARVMEKLVKAGPNTIAAHLAHLKEHGATQYYNQAVTYLKEHNISVPLAAPPRLPCGCPGSAVRYISSPALSQPSESAAPLAVSALRNWPIQIALVPPSAPYLAGADLLISADCVGSAHPNFHSELVQGKVLLIGCPKLDDAMAYQEKLTEIFRTTTPKSVTVAHMIVPCCFGLVQLVRAAIKASGKTIPFAEVTIDLDGTTKNRR
ncbi:MAG: 4Fe-4S binding protein [candidate division WOR-3 bacterium]